jgi:hypothetical protein
MAMSSATASSLELYLAASRAKTVRELELKGAAIASDNEQQSFPHASPDQTNSK